MFAHLGLLGTAAMLPSTTVAAILVSMKGYALTVSAASSAPVRQVTLAKPVLSRSITVHQLPAKMVVPAQISLCWDLCVCARLIPLVLCVRSRLTPVLPVPACMGTVQRQQTAIPAAAKLGTQDHCVTPRIVTEWCVAMEGSVCLFPLTMSVCVLQGSLV